MKKILIALGFAQPEPPKQLKVIDAMAAFHKAMDELSVVAADHERIAENLNAEISKKMDVRDEAIAEANVARTIMGRMHAFLTADPVPAELGKPNMRVVTEQSFQAAAR